MQIESLNRQKWRTNPELAVVMADDIERFCKSDRRHSSVDYLTPKEFEDLESSTTKLATLSEKWSTEWGQAQLERLKGIEPSSSVWKTEALPLSYSRVFRNGEHNAAAFLPSGEALDRERKLKRSSEDLRRLRTARPQWPGRDPTSTTWCCRPSSRRSRRGR